MYWEFTSSGINIGGRRCMICAPSFQKSMLQQQCLASPCWRCSPSSRSGSRLEMKPSVSRVSFGGSSPETRTPMLSSPWSFAQICLLCFVSFSDGFGATSIDKQESTLWGLSKIVKAMAFFSCYRILTAKLQISLCQQWWLQWWGFLPCTIMEKINETKKSYDLLLGLVDFFHDVARQKSTQIAVRWPTKSDIDMMQTKNYLLLVPLIVVELSWELSLSQVAFREQPWNCCLFPDARGGTTSLISSSSFDHPWCHWCHWFQGLRSHFPREQVRLPDYGCHFHCVISFDSEGGPYHWCKPFHFEAYLWGGEVNSCMRAMNAASMSDPSVSHLILDCKSINGTDMTGCEAIENLAISLEKRKKSLVLANLKAPLTQAIFAAGVNKHIEAHGGHLCWNIAQAIDLVNGANPRNAKQSVTDLHTRVQAIGATPTQCVPEWDRMMSKTWMARIWIGFEHVSVQIGWIQEMDSSLKCSHCLNCHIRTCCDMQTHSHQLRYAVQALCEHGKQKRICRGLHTAKHKARDPFPPIICRVFSTMSFKHLLNLLAFTHTGGCTASEMICLSWQQVDEEMNLTCLTGELPSRKKPL